MLTTSDDMQIHHFNKIVTKHCGIGAEKRTWPEYDSNPGPLAHRASILPNGLPSPKTMPNRRDSAFAARIPSTGPTLSHQMSQGGNRTLPGRVLAR